MEDKFAGPVEADETYSGGKAGNKRSSKKLRAGWGTVGKTSVVGVKDRAANKVKTQVVKTTDARTLQGFAAAQTDDGALVYTDAARAYNGLARPHAAVKHSGEYVRRMAHTNGMESPWATLKRGYDGVYHPFSAKPWDRYGNEFAGRHNFRPRDTAEPMAELGKTLEGLSESDIAEISRMRTAWRSTLFRNVVGIILIPCDCSPLFSETRSSRYGDWKGCPGAIFAAEGRTPRVWITQTCRSCSM